MNPEKQLPNDYVKDGKMHEFYIGLDGEIHEDVYDTDEPDDGDTLYTDEFSVLGGLGAWLRGEYD